jgi:outer membrane protein assembly factor BamB
MKVKTGHIIPALLILAGTGFLVYWLSANPSGDLTRSIPGMDNRGAGVEAVAEMVNIGEYFERFRESGSTLNESWSRFRGADYDNISKSPVALIDHFSDPPPEILWSVNLGEGHAGPAIYKGRVYLLDYDEEKRSDMLRCFNLDGGEEIWRRWYRVEVKRNHGMSRTVPAVTERYILTIGPRSHVMCMDRESGDLLWSLDVVKEYNSELPFWYTGQCPMIDDGVAVIATGGSALLVGIDCRTGRVLWETPNEFQWKMSHSSVMPFVFEGIKMYVYSAVGGVCGIAAESGRTGEILWSTGEWNHSVVAPSPVCMPDGKIFLTAGYGAGSMVLQLYREGNELSARVVDVYSPKEGLACEQQTPLYYRGHLFGIQPKDAGPSRNQLVCVHPSDCRKIVWSSGQTARFGLGPYMIADDKIFLLNDDGTLYIIEPSTSSYRELSSFRVMEGHDAWAPLAVANGYLLLRDSKTMICISIKA